MIKEFCSIAKPEYIALMVSVVAIFINVYISRENRKHSLAKEEYFKLQQTVEKIIAKLLILNNQQERLKTYIELNYKASQMSDGVFVDANDTFNKDIFEKNGEEIAAMIDIYFDDIGKEWNYCLEKIGHLHTLAFILGKNIENKKTIDWKKEIEDFNKISSELAEKPEQIAKKLKQKLTDFKRDNL
jgi:hypothetical protein